MTSLATSFPSSIREAACLSNLNAVRLLIVLYIAFGYSSTMPLGPGYPEIFNIFGYDPSWVGIQLLFFVSGLMAMRSIALGRTGFTYLSSRFTRNIPLLFTLTIATLIVLFPLFGTPLDAGADFFKRVAKYVFVTTFCISPGMPIQGLMDDAKYMCLIQGGIWTLRYGAILHIIAAISGRLNLLSQRRLLLGVTVATILAYIALGLAIAKNDMIDTSPALTGLRLAYAFLLGMTAWAYRDKLLSLKAKFWSIPVGLFALGFLNHTFWPWSPAIEVLLTMSFMCLVWMTLWSEGSFSKFFKNWPILTLPVMLINWPLAQTLLLIFPDISSWGLIALTLPLTVILSLGVWALFYSAGKQTRRLQSKIAKSS